MKLRLEETEMPALVLHPEEQLNLLRAIDECPHGVIGWSPTLEGLVETSDRGALCSL